MHGFARQGSKVGQCMPSKVRIEHFLARASLLYAYFLFGRAEASAQEIRMLLPLGSNILVSDASQPGSSLV